MRDYFKRIMKDIIIVIGLVFIVPANFKSYYNRAVSDNTKMRYIRETVAVEMKTINFLRKASLGIFFIMVICGFFYLIPVLLFALQKILFSIFQQCRIS